MCDVATAGLIVQGAGALSNTYSAIQQEKAYGQYQMAQTQSALSNYIQQSKQVNLRYAQEQEADSEERQQIHIENMKAKATAQASAVSSGIEGITIDNLFAGYNRASAISDYTHARNMHMLGLEYTNQLESYRNQALSTIYSIPAYSGATAGSTLLNSAGGIMSGYSDMKWKQEYYKSNKTTSTTGRSLFPSRTK